MVAEMRDAAVRGVNAASSTHVRVLQRFCRRNHTVPTIRVAKRRGARRRTRRPRATQFRYFAFDYAPEMREHRVCLGGL